MTVRRQVTITIDAPDEEHADRAERFVADHARSLPNTTLYDHGISKSLIAPGTPSRSWNFETTMVDVMTGANPYESLLRWIVKDASYVDISSDRIMNVDTGWIDGTPEDIALLKRIMVEERT